MSFLSNPRKPTTTAPLARARRSLSAKWAVLGARPDDRGGFRPVGGFAVALPNGDVGGVPAIPPPLLDGLQFAKLPKVNTLTAKAFVQSVGRRVHLEQLAAKPAVRIVPGFSALTAAKLGPLRFDSRLGVTLDRAGLRDVRPRTLRGTLAQHRTAPASVVGALVGQRITRSVQGAPSYGESGAYTFVQAPKASEVAKLDAGASVAFGTQPDFGAPAVRQAPQETITTSAAGGNQAERFAFLAVVAAVAFFALKGR